MGEKLISFVIPCYNEEANIVPLCEAITEIMEKQLPEYDYEIIFSDNKSEDRTREYLRELAGRNRRIKVLLNDCNYTSGSMKNAILYTRGDVTILMFADFQDPPELIPKYIKYWEEGYKIIPAVRTGSQESKIIKMLRGMFYWILEKTSGLNIIHHYNGTGCYDKQFIDLCKKNMSHDWNMRIFVAKHGEKIKEMKFEQPSRKGGKSSNNLLSLVNQASDFIMMYLNKKLPMIVIMISLLGIGFSSVLGVYYFAMKLTHWDSFQAGMAPLLLLLLIFMFAQNMLFAQILILLFALDKQAGGECLDLEKIQNKNGNQPAYLRVFLQFSSFFEKSYKYLPIAGFIGISGTLAVLTVSLIFKIMHWNEYILGITPAVLITCILLGTLILWGGIIRYYLMRVSFLLKKSPLAVVKEKINFD